jgi:hypothetical protein
MRVKSEFSQEEPREGEYLQGQGEDVAFYFGV